MTANLLDPGSEVSPDLSPEWLALSARVRQLAAEAGPHTPLAQNAIRLCEHVERLHSDCEQLLASLSASNAAARAVTSEALESLPKPPPAKIDEANIEIQREMHQKGDLQHIIKALFMWKDDPVERVRTKND